MRVALRLSLIVLAVSSVAYVLIYPIAGISWHVFHHRFLLARSDAALLDFVLVVSLSTVVVLSLTTGALMNGLRSLKPYRRALFVVCGVLALILLSWSAWRYVPHSTATPAQSTTVELSPNDVEMDQPSQISINEHIEQVAAGVTKVALSGGFAIFFLYSAFKRRAKKN